MAWSLLAAGEREDPLRSPEVVWGTVGIALALLVGALAVWMMERWRKGATAAKTDVAGELTDYRGMYERGEITEDEYAKLRNRVAARVHSAIQPTPAAPAGGAAPAATPQQPALPKELADLADVEDEDGDEPPGAGERKPGPDAPPPGPDGPANPPPPA